MIKKLNSLLDKKFIQLLILFLYLQPVIDIVTSFMVRYSDSVVTAGIFIRVIALIIIMYYALFLVRSRFSKYLVLYITLMAIYCIAYLANAFITKGSGFVFTEIKSLIKMLYFPLTLVMLCYIFWQKKIKIDVMHFIISAAVYAILIFIAVISNTSFQSYDYGKLGGTGWFYAPNETGATLSILFPIFFFTLIKYHKNILYWILLPIYIFVCLWVGTKAPMIAVLLTIASAAFVYFIRLIFFQKKAKSAVVVLYTLAIVILTMYVIPYTPCGKNLKIHFLKANVKSISDFFRPGASSSPTGQTPAPSGLNPTSTPGSTSLTTPKPNTNNVIFSSRDIYLKTALKDYMDSPILPKLIGEGYILKMANGGVRYVSVEMDFYDVLFRLGIIGTILYFAPFLALLLLILVQGIKRFKELLKSNETLGFAICIFLSLGISYIAGHVLTAPAVSIFVALAAVSLSSNLRGLMDEK